ncbi:fimbrial biogenesis outer membrane usher protein [Sphingomonas sp. AP4-R1]|uniref:fimbria/pilus outer membrane usher protein n=1 Tax=Sphingomonas sp. AP4-R1 TaxID=2735134 RepID=UPI00149395C0|nr:fimbria/pilus outer membrane usher protein [Sphingomonas sp. AP4-R1]QJU56994.1 fimbrial biogenesis outer membrane usher protein [Sphingomonas sp. AP4-R1]
MRRGLLETALGVGAGGMLCAVSAEAAAGASPPSAELLANASRPWLVAASGEDISVTLAQIGQPPKSSTAPPPQTMLLDVTLNGTPTGQLLRMKQDADGRFSGKAGELRGIRIKLDPALGSQEDIAFDDLAGVSYRYDEARQAIALQVPDALLTSYQLGLGGERTPIDLDAVRPTPGFLLNYGLYGARAQGGTQFSGNAEAVAMTGFGIVATNGIFRSRPGLGSSGAVRLDSSWRLIDPKAIRSYTLGDFASNALAWTSSVRLAGFQIASAFDQRPDIVTAALPQFSGSAALPSTVDLFVNQQKIYSGEVPSGPFDLKSLPYVSGGDVRLVTTDATGRQVEVTKAYFYSANLLRRGVLQYSLDVGAPRLSYGVRSFDYDEVVFASGSARYGVTQVLTIEGHGEGSTDGLLNAGGGATTAIGGYGAITASIAGSRYKGHHGGKLSVDVDANVRGVRLFAGTDRTLGDYFDLARVSSQRSIRSYDAASPLPSGNLLAATAQASAIDRAGIAFTPWFDRTSISLSYNRIVSPGNRSCTGSLSLSRGITDRISLYASGYRNLDGSHHYGLFATLSMRFGQTVSVSAGTEHDNGRTAYTVQATGSTGQRQGDFGWGLSDRESDGNVDAQRTGYVTYRAAQALLRAQVDQSGSAWRGSVQVDGSLVAAGGGIFAANRIGQAFAVVTHAGPHVEVIQGGARMGKTNGAGRALLPDLIPYYTQRLAIDPASLPDGWEPEATERFAVAGYRQGAVVDFGAKIVRGAILVLQDADGRPIPPGYVAQVQGGEPATVGYGGETYVRGLGPSNRISIDLGPRGTCTASFPYDMAGPAQPKIGPLACR